MAFDREPFALCCPPTPRRRHSGFGASATTLPRKGGGSVWAWVSAHCTPGLFVLVIGVFSGCAHVKSADLVLVNGKIVTVDDDRPVARALAVRGDTIVAVGGDEKVRSYVSGNTRVIDLEGRLAVPGFVEGHGHFMSLGLSRMQLDLAGVRDWDEIVEMVESSVRKSRPGEWILGRGWHQEKWDRAPVPDVDGLPVHDALSRVSPDNPVLLTHASGHSCIANAKAMELAGVDRESPDPPGGEIVRDARGESTGAFRETAEDLLAEALKESRKARTPGQIEAEQRRAVELATGECLSKGVTSFQDAGSSFEVIDFYRRLAGEGKLGIRLWVMISADLKRLSAEDLDRYRIVDPGDRRLTVRAIKTYVDGALGSHGAWLLEPYSDFPDSTGLCATPVEEIEKTAELAIKKDFQLCAHAIGDRGNRVILDIYEKVFREFPGGSDLRWRVEHAQHLHPDDIPRFAELEVIASVQGIHCTSDGPWVIKRLGQKRASEGAYAWRKLIDSGAVVSNGTDTPVEDVDPIAGFHALVTREMKDGRAFFPEQRMSREEALRACTIDAAYAAFEDDVKGSLEPGKLADIVVLSRDITTVPADEIPGTEVLYTIVGGKVVYRKTTARSP